MLFHMPAYGRGIQASSQINDSFAVLQKKGTGELSVFFFVQATKIMDIIGASSIEIQRNTISGWITEYTFTPDNTPRLQEKNKSQYNTELTYSPIFTGKIYRAVVMIYAADTSGTSTRELTTQTVKT